MKQRHAQRRHIGGATLIEVLVTIVIITFGLLGMAGLQMRMQVSELESYQRSQALLLLNDMAQRIATNRNNATQYVTGTSSPLGTNFTCTTTTTTTADRDLGEWCGLLKGYSESDSSSNKVGGLIGARGCVENVGGDYMVTVVWQGMTPIAAPPTSVACGSGLYNTSTGGTCTNDRCRRAVTTLVRIGTLT